MTKWLLNLIKAVRNRLDLIIKNAEVTSELHSADAAPYHSLSPVKDADVSHYIKVLTWALQNRSEKSIYNIALTGPYGSGKSSILKTFQEQNKNKEFVFLEISLATFKEEAVPEAMQNDTANDTSDGQGEIPKVIANGNVSGKNNDDILRLIELSILQQIFYHEEDDKIPDSRFKKIRSFKKKTMRLITAYVLTSIMFGINLFFPKRIEKLLRIEFPDLIVLFLHWVSLIVFLVAMAIVIYRSIRLSYSLKISKFKFQEAEIEIDKGISKSILNNHLDEILYFFEATDYSVVLIEDLDRFRQAEIFTKLRELNLLINKSKKVEQDVVFIYAVRDEMFWNKDRTKFFDFIIPVIPVINSSNSNEKLATIIKDNGYEISGQLIDDVSLFIDDMRLLYNITNEYSIYSALLDNALNQDKLLAIIVYKNIYPDDFVLLSNGEGKLYDLLNKRSKYVKDALKVIDDSIAAHKSEIKEFSNTVLKDANELRLLYIAHFVEKTSAFQYFRFNENTYSLVKAAEENAFEYFKSGNFTYGTPYNGNAGPSNFDFKEIEQEVDSNYSYEQRLKHITSLYSGKDEQLKKEIAKLEKQKVSIRHAKIQEILTDKSTKTEIDTSTKQGILLSLLLRSGYINEDYLDYISLFYEGSITKEDRAFLLNVKSQQSSDYDTSLSKIENLIEKISLRDFQEPYLLNYNILDFVLGNENYQSQLDNLLIQLNDDNEYGPQFIEGFISNGINIEVFIKKLVNRWTGIWQYIKERSTFTEERIEEYFKLIIANADVSDLKLVAENSTLEETISIRKDFLTLIPDPSQLRKIITTLDVRFKDIDLAGAPQELASLIYLENHYEINRTMVSKIMMHAGNFNLPVFEQSNYYSILNSNIPELIAYLDINIDHYISTVYLPLPQNTAEPESALMQLLDNADITFANRSSIIARSDTNISELSGLESNELDGVLFEYYKIVPTWENLIEYFSRHDNLDATIDYLNEKDNAITLSTKKINTDKPYLGSETTTSFTQHLLNEESLSNDTYQLLVKSIRHEWEFDKVSGISEEKMAILIDASIIGPYPENYEKLKEEYAGLHLAFIEKYSADFLGAIDDFPVDGNDIAFLLRSVAFTPEEKNTIITSVDQSIILKSTASLNEIASLIFAHHPFTIPKDILMGVLQQARPVQERVKLFNMHYKLLSKPDIQNIFSTYPYPYSDIGVTYKSPTIDFTAENRFLEHNLKELKFISNSKDEKKGIKLISFKKL